MFSYHQQQDTQAPINISGQQMPGFCFSNPADATPEFLRSMDQQVYCHQQPPINSFDFNPYNLYANNNMVMPFDDMYIKPEQQPFHSDMPFVGIQNYLSPVSYDNVHMMSAPPTTIPASPLSSVFSSTSSPHMDDFLSMDNNGVSFSDIENHISSSQSTKKAAPQCTAKKGTSIMHIKNNTAAKKKKRQVMAPVLGEYVCDFKGCGKIFGRKYNLSSHLVTHYAERKYLCDHCPKAFVRRHDLKRHMRIHTGETPHKCIYCDRGFGRADALQRHYLTDNTCAPRYNNDPLRSCYKKKTRSTGFGAKA